jgi:hypothetical protein
MSAGRVSVADWSDDWNEWNSITGNPNVLGFVSFYYFPGRLFLSPSMGPAVTALLQQGPSADHGYLYTEAVSLMVLVHESYHWRFNSGDEAYVNACTLRDFPYWLTQEVGVQPTTQQAQTTYVTVPHDKVVTKYVWKLKKVKGKRKRVRVKVTTHVTTYEQVPQTTSVTVPNPTYQEMVNDSRTFYASQPYPYNAGTCPSSSSSE